MFSLADLLEGIAALRKAVILMVMVCYSKGTQDSVRIKVEVKGRVQETTGLPFSLVFPSEVAWAVFYSPSSDGLRPCGVLLLRQGHLLIAGCWWMLVNGQMIGPPLTSPEWGWW